MLATYLGLPLLHLDRGELGPLALDVNGHEAERGRIGGREVVDEADASHDEREDVAHAASTLEMRISLVVHYSRLLCMVYQKIRGTMCQWLYVECHWRLLWPR